MERRLHLFWPLTLIAAGILWILIVSGRIPAANLWALAYLWPIILITSGLGLILRRYWRLAGALLSALAVAVLFLGVVYAAQLGWNTFPVNGLDVGWFDSGPMDRGSGHVITQTRNVTGFSSIRIDYPASVVVQQGAADALTIQAEDNVVADMQTRVVDGVLEITATRDHAVHVMPTRPVKVTVVAKDLSALDFDSAGDVTLQALKTNSLTLTLGGAGNISLLGAKLGSLDARLQGAGSLQATGAVDDLNVRVDGVGNFNGKDLRSQRASVALNGLGNADVWANSQLTARVTGVGSINYSGNALVTKEVLGVGAINFTGSK